MSPKAAAPSRASARKSAKELDTKTPLKAAAASKSSSATEKASSISTKPKSAPRRPQARPTSRQRDMWVQIESRREAAQRAADAVQDLLRLKNRDKSNIVKTTAKTKTAANSNKKRTRDEADDIAESVKRNKTGKPKTVADSRKRARDESDDSTESVKRSKPAKAQPKKPEPTSTAAKKTAAKKGPVKKIAGADTKTAEPKKKPAAKKETEAAPPKPKAPAKVRKVSAAKPAPKKVIINHVPTIERRFYVMGEGGAGELGLGATKGACNVMRPRLNKLLDDRGVVDLAVGGMHCVALTRNNELLTWGVNDNKALGRPLPEWSAREVDDDASDFDDDEGLDLNPHEATPTAIPQEYFPPGTTFVQVAAGDSASYALTDDGLVYGWGTYRNDTGVWGFTIDENGKLIREQKTPFLIPGLRNIKGITCGDNHALAIDVKGIVYGWGSGQQDQLGRRIVARHAEKNLLPAPVPLPKSGKIEKVIAGPNHSFAIGKDGGVWAWGLNNFAQTGIPYPPEKDNDIITAPQKVSSLQDHVIKTLGCGANHSVALNSSGELLTFGRLENWALGVKFDHLLDDPEQVRKSEESGKPKILLKPTKIDIPQPCTAISCGPDHNIAITEAGKAWAWGFNANLQCGVGREADDVKMPEELTSKSLGEQKLDWAGCGGQFSVIGGAR